MRCRLLPLVILLFGNFAGSTSALFIKECGVEPLALSGWRLLMATAILAPWCIRDLRRHGTAAGRQTVRRYFAPAAALAVHFALWSWAVP
ncbi:MAG: hypothetical protein N3A66_10455, partial [Planctomycetota bacterium]|nr:hypothetical protein [Planctomycetota bacterium]